MSRVIESDMNPLLRWLFSRPHCFDFAEMELALASSAISLSENRLPTDAFGATASLGDLSSSEAKPVPPRNPSRLGHPGTRPNASAEALARSTSPECHFSQRRSIAAWCGKSSSPGKRAKKVN